MLRKIGYSLLCAGSLFSASALAMTYNIMPGPGASFEYKLLANSPIMIGNPYYHKMTATCTIFSEDESNEIIVEMILKSSKVNNEEIKSGETRPFNIPSGSKLVLEADGRAVVKLLNKGPSDITAKCTI
ncbi:MULTISPECIES: hypothetical protein [Legionella]|uniref:Uncharacterized protein n=1 Tax=Legionella drozanskii LLAP-1 TaxID=1212489 RepID=A0A0W0SKY3_9GAMM|nr:MULTISPECIES: hypothetical protein [Legionella]KTC83982.1 hypothetical protein Ldro_3102 [Legionella drozanskii LLAP-1]PJE15849.1 MAG: hypothetical protein CK430_03840 [Legionella sp.]